MFVCILSLFRFKASAKTIGLIWSKLVSRIDAREVILKDFENQAPFWPKIPVTADSFSINFLRNGCGPVLGVLSQNESLRCKLLPYLNEYFYLNN